MRCGRFTLDLSHTNLMGVLNSTPDSFSDGGAWLDPTRALAHARQMIADGADIIDIGAESTRPGAREVPAEEEIARLTPIVQALVADGTRPVSIDSKKTAVMAAMLELGVDLINDVHGLEDDGALELLARYPDVAICLMHMRGMPDTMQDNTDYADVVAEVDAYLQARALEARQQLADASTPALALAKPRRKTWRWYANAVASNTGATRYCLASRANPPSATTLATRRLANACTAA